MKYSRIQVNYNGNTGKPDGVFAAGHYLLKKGALSPEEAKMFKETDEWFDQHLPEPEYYKRGNPEKAVSWFKENALPLVDRLNPVVDMLARHGIECHMVRTDTPGRIIYEDEYQVGAV
jgi:hypothetical protein